MKLTEAFTASKTETHPSDIACVVCHKGFVFSTADDGVVKVWTRDLKPVSEFKAHDYAVTDIAFEANGDLLTASNDFTIKAWTASSDMKTWTLKTTMKGHEESIRKLAVYEGQVFSGDDKGEVRVWRDNRLEGVIDGVEEIWDMAVANDRLFTVRDRDVVVASMNPTRINVTIINTMFGKAPIRVMGEHVIFLDRGGMEIQVHDAKVKGNPFRMSLRGHEMIINALACDHARSTLYSGGWDEKVIVWNLETKKRLTELPTTGYINTLTVDGGIGEKAEYLYIGGANGSITAYKIETD